MDLAGNADTRNITFEVESDYSPPLVVRAYHEAPNLVVMTNEEAECVYDTANCVYDFEDGIEMNAVDGKIHYINWETGNTMYIKCRDKYGKEPEPDQCSIEVVAFETKE